MSQLEWRSVDSEEFIREIGEAVSQHRENKYAFQVGLRDIDFEIDQDLVSVLGVALPFNSIEQAERALRKRVIRPAMLLEEDEIEHQAAVFDPEPVGFSGFMRCVTHSLVLTDQGLFEVGPFQAMSLFNQNHHW